MRRCMLLLGLLGAGCAAPPPDPARVVEPAHPARVLVRDFAVDPAAVQLDQVSQVASAAEAERVGGAHAAQETLAATLVYRLRAMGLTVERAATAGDAVAGDILVDGRIDRIDEGDRAKRANGGGRPEVAGLLRVLVPTQDHGAAPIGDFEASSQSTGTPGLAGGAAASAAALGTGGERGRALRQAGISAEARRLGNVFADQLRGMFAKRGWISAAS